MKELQFRISMRIKQSYYFCVAVINNRIAEYLDARFANKKRQWTAHGTFGSGVVPLGKITLDKAIEKTGSFGTVVYTDVEQAIIFYSERGS